MYKSLLFDRLDFDLLRASHGLNRQTYQTDLDEAKPILDGKPSNLNEEPSSLEGKCLPNPSGRVTLTDPSPSSAITQLVPGWRGLEVGTGWLVVIGMLLATSLDHIFIYKQGIPAILCYVYFYFAQIWETQWTSSYSS